MEKYVKVSTIGSGTFGAVYLVQKSENKKYVIATVITAGIG